jgi:hypothetical protein
MFSKYSDDAQVLDWFHIRVPIQIAEESLGILLVHAVSSNARNDREVLLLTIRTKTQKPESSSIIHVHQIFNNVPSIRV